MAKLIHFGEDSCHRLMVLEGVGYAVARCESINDLEFHLRLAEKPRAVILSGERSSLNRVETYLANTVLPLPVIRFADSDQAGPNSGFDLVIPNLTSPSEWLSSIEGAIARFQAERGSLTADTERQFAGQTGQY